LIETILITGNKGFIGSYIEKTLSDSYTTVGLSRADGFDITNYTSLKKPESKIDIIIHAAAIATNDYEASFETNVLGTLNLCKYAKEHGIKRFILLSSIFAFDEKDNGTLTVMVKQKKLLKKLLLHTAKRMVLNLPFSDWLKFMMMPDWHKVGRQCFTTLLTPYKHKVKLTYLVVPIH